MAPAKGGIWRYGETGGRRATYWGGFCKRHHICVSEGVSYPMADCAIDMDPFRGEFCITSIRIVRSSG